jgi:CBS domain-containing protein
VHDLGTVEQALDLLGRHAIRHVVIVQDLGERPPAMVFADDVLRNALLSLRSSREERERAPDRVDESHSGPSIVADVKAPARAGRFAERIVEGRDDGGRSERVVIWIERRPGAIWAVGRQVNPQHRETESPREDDYLWQGHELEDCLEAANGALEDDAVVSEELGTPETVKPFHRAELLKPLERFFFGR